MNRWITADWHLGEDRLDLMQRPFKSTEEHIYALLENHNKLVAPNDDVIVVGDVCFKKYPAFLPMVKQFHGNKTLIRGNHDAVFTDEQLRPYFDLIVREGDGIELDAGGIPCYATHYPTRGRPDRFNLVGHIHSSWKVQLNMLNVGVDVHHFRPVNLDRIRFFLQAITDFYDDDVWVAGDPINLDYASKRGKPGTYFKMPAPPPKPPAEVLEPFPLDEVDWNNGGGQAVS